MRVRVVEKVGCDVLGGDMSFRLMVWARCAGLDRRATRLQRKSYAGVERRTYERVSFYCWVRARVLLLRKLGQRWTEGGLIKRLEAPSRREQAERKQW